MEGGSAESVVARIEAAIARIEQAAVRRNETAAQLRFRHDRLKVAVGQSLRELDALLESQKR